MLSGSVVILLVVIATITAAVQEVPISSYIYYPKVLTQDRYRDPACTNSSTPFAHWTCQKNTSTRLPGLSDNKTRDGSTYEWRAISKPVVVMNMEQTMSVKSVNITYLVVDAVNVIYKIPFLSISVHGCAEGMFFEEGTKFYFPNVNLTEHYIHAYIWKLYNLTEQPCGCYVRIEMANVNGKIGLVEVDVLAENVTDTATIKPHSGYATTSLHTSSTGSTVATTEGPRNLTSQPTAPNSGRASSGNDHVILLAVVPTVLVLLLVVLLVIIIAIVIVCCLTRQKKGRSLNQFSVQYSSRRKSSEFKDDKDYVLNNRSCSPVSFNCNNRIASGPYDKNDATRNNYAAFGPSESIPQDVNAIVLNDNNNDVPPVEAVGGRSPSQNSISSATLDNKMQYGTVTWVHPGTLDHPYDSCTNQPDPLVGGPTGGYPLLTIPPEPDNIMNPTRKANPNLYASLPGASTTNETTERLSPATEQPTSQPAAMTTTSSGYKDIQFGEQAEPQHSTSIPSTTQLEPSEDYTYSAVDKPVKRSASFRKNERLNENGKRESVRKSDGLLDDDFWGASDKSQTLSGQSTVSKNGLEADVSEDRGSNQEHVYSSVNYSKKTKR